MTQPHSCLLSLVNRNFEGVNATALAEQLGWTVIDLQAQELSVARLLDADLLAAGPALLLGTGEVDFDARVAAALGSPLVLLIDAPGPAAELAAEHAASRKAVVAAQLTADELTADALRAAAEEAAQPVMGPEAFEAWLLKQAATTGSHIVLPEGDDDRILQAAHQLLEGGVVKLTILGDPEAIRARAGELNLDLADAQLLDPQHNDYVEDFAAEFAELRKKRGVTLEQARETMKDISYFATMMVHKGLADGMVSGAAHTTAHTIKPSFQIIKTAPGASVVSSIFLMVMQGRLWAFGDCAVNPNPTPEQLGEIAVVSAKTAAQFGIDPKVSLLSYSTGTSGAGPDVEAVAAAVEHARSLDGELAVDGPLQFDASVEPSVAAKKAPESAVAGQATVFIFPDLQSGNIGYKIAQRTGDALAVGPILQGLNKPINDLSRGATVPDIVNTVAITAIQAGGNK
ncbi:phosphate acetyltransferase [Corynebacterium uberis]|uniref:phosphate acetyltransferase n=1 Tax=Corynebacterium uberis TaxID=2883169 RepID=UPI001D09DB43|nr:phosphate acetyltransferase [Corynebacterium uberis]UDL73502.1 phosphate acetyltransferase [Corynebacterium uberis]UDL82247.1 phosphate acetyltransferase [Corynebacterium uberis]